MQKHFFWFQCGRFDIFLMRECSKIFAGAVKEGGAPNIGEILTTDSASKYEPLQQDERILKIGNM